MNETELISWLGLIVGIAGAGVGVTGFAYGRYYRTKESTFNKEIIQNSFRVINQYFQEKRKDLEMLLKMLKLENNTREPFEILTIRLNLSKESVIDYSDRMIDEANFLRGKIRPQLNNQIIFLIQRIKIIYEPSFVTMWGREHKEAVKHWLGEAQQTISIIDNTKQEIEDYKF